MRTEATPPEDGDTKEPARPTPEAFGQLTKKEMLAHMRRLGIEHGKRKKKTGLMSLYRDWYGASATTPDTRAVAITDEERRTTKRTKINVEIGLRTETNFFVGFSGDISEGGIFVTTVTLLPVGTSVSLSFSFPGGIEIEADGDVAWTREGAAFDSELSSGMGIRFTHLGEPALAAIHEFTSIREPIFYDD